MMAIADIIFEYGSSNRHPLDTAPLSTIEFRVTVCFCCFCCCCSVVGLCTYSVVGQLNFALQWFVCVWGGGCFFVCLFLLFSGRSLYMQCCRPVEFRATVGLLLLLLLLLFSGGSLHI